MRCDHVGSAYNSLVQYNDSPYTYCYHTSRWIVSLVYGDRERERDRERDRESKERKRKRKHSLFFLRRTVEIGEWKEMMTCIGGCRDVTACNIYIITPTKPTASCQCAMLSFFHGVFVSFFLFISFYSFYIYFVIKRQGERQARKWLIPRQLHVTNSTWSSSVQVHQPLDFSTACYVPTAPAKRRRRRMIMTLTASITLLQHLHLSKLPS